MGRTRFMRRLLFVAACGLAPYLYAANDDVFAACSTQGPDCYADGSRVCDGESYALVYTQPGKVFAGFQADGSLVDAASSELVMTLPTALDGRCRRTLCVLPKTYANRRTTGVWELYLLDTRRADGRPAGLSATGAPNRVNSWGATRATIDFQTSAFSQQAARMLSFAAPEETASVAARDYTSVASERSRLPADVLPPRVTGISVDGANVTLKVADTKPYLTYDVAGSVALGTASERVARTKADGADGAEIVLEADGARARFFKVVADR